MYLTLRDRPIAERRISRDVKQRVTSTVVPLGVVSMFTDISTASANAVLPKYLIFVVGLSPRRSLDSLGAAIGPLIAFWILTVVLDGYHAVFAGSLGFAVVGVAVLLLVVPALRPGRRHDLPGNAGVARPGKVTSRHLADPQMARVLIAAALLGLVTVGDAFLYLTLQPRDNLATDYYVLLMVGMNVSYLLFAVPLGRLPDRIRRAKIFVSGHVALLGCYIRWNQIGLMNAILLVCFPVAAVIMRGLDRSRTA